MDRLASALQSILGKPVINETDISGAYRFTFVWGEDRVAALAAALRNKFGLELTPGKRDLDALVVDRIEADGATSILGRIGRLTSGAPSDVRRTISNAFTIR